MATWRAENYLRVLDSAESMEHFQSKNTPNNVLAMLDDGRPIVSDGAMVMLQVQRQTEYQHATYRLFAQHILVFMLGRI